MDTATYETIKDELRYRLTPTGTHAKRNRGKVKREYLTKLVKRDEMTMSNFLAFCAVSSDDVATVAQSILDKWDGKGDWLAEAVAMQDEYRDARETTSTLLAF